MGEIIAENAVITTPKSWVPLYYNGGVTIGAAKFSEDGRSIEIVLNEGAEIGELMQEGLIGLSTMSMSVNDAQKTPRD